MRSIYLRKTGSTNDYAREYCKREEPVDPTLIYTFQQDRGKGQRGKSWSGQFNRNLTFTLVISGRDLLCGTLFDITRRTSLGVLSFLEEHLDSNALSIKWPNDLYYTDHKIGGILIENIFQGKDLKYSCVGVGININQETFDSEMKNPISIAQITNQKNCLIECQITAARHIMKWMTKDRLSDLIEYERRLYRKGVKSRYITQDGLEVTGTVLGVSPEGKLRMRIQNKTHFFDLKEIEFSV